MLTLSASKCDNGTLIGKVYFLESTSSNIQSVTCGSIINPNPSNSSNTTVSFDYFPIQNGFLTGTRYYTAIYIPSTGANINQRYYSGTVAVTATTLPDLQVSFTSLTSQTIYAGDQTTAYYNLKNLGGSTTSSFYVRFYLATSTSGNNETLISNSSILFDGLQANYNGNENKPLIIPAGTPSGVYYVRIKVDPEGNVNESNLNNNIDLKFLEVLQVVVLPDLYISGSSLSSQNVQSGQNVTVNYTIGNNGSVAGSFAMNYYLSTNTIFDAQDVLLNSSSVASYPGNYNSTGSKSLTIPINTADGSYYIITVSDANNNVAESNENNNNDFIFLNVSTPTAPNLQLGACTVVSPNPLVQGQNKSFTYSVKNVGNATFTGTIKLGVTKPNGSASVVDEQPSQSIAPNEIKNYTSATNLLDAANNPVGSYQFTVQSIATGSTTANTVSTIAGCANPVVVSVVADANCPNCLTNRTLTDFPNTGNEGLCAAQYLCSKGIIASTQSKLPSATLVRQDIAKMVALSLMNDSDIPNVATYAFVTDNFPSPFADLTNTTLEAVRYAKLLMYLQLDDEVSPFDRKTLFNPTNTISRANALKVLLEAWNIDETSASGFSVLFTDPNINTHSQINYIKKAAQLGVVLNVNGAFRPDDICKREEFFVMLKRLRVLNYAIKPNLTNINNYFVPANITAANIHIGQGAAQGNFSHAESAFSVGDVGFDLDFGFNYESFRTELPAQYHLFEPMTAGWNHNYNAYIYRTTTPIVLLNDVSNSPQFIELSPAQTNVVWGDGSVDIYKADNSPITADNKDSITVITPLQISIRRKDFSVYTFDKQVGENDVYRLTSIADKFGNQMNIFYKTITPVILFLDNMATYPYAIDYVQAPSGRRITFGYDNNAKISQITFPGETSNTRTVSFGYTNGRLTSFTNARGKTTTYSYGTNPRELDLLQQITLPKGNKIQVMYDGKNNKIGTFKAVGSNGTTVSNQSVGGIASTWGADKTMTTTMTDSQTNIASINTFNPMGVNASSSSTQANVTIIKAFGDTQNPSSPTSINQNGTIATIEYYPNGNLKKTTQPNGATQQYFYDAYNNLTSLIDAKGNTTIYNYSTDGRSLQNIQQPSSSGTLTQSFTYHPNGLMQTSTNHENITSNFTYDSYGNLTNTALPVLGLSSSATYDYASRTKTSTNAKNQTSTFIYDLNDNLSGVKDPQNHNTTYDYDDNDNLGIITNAKGQQTTFGYDTYDRAISETFDGKTKTYNYNATTGLLDQYLKPSGNAFNYSYDPASKRLKSNGYVTNIDYHPQTNLMTSIRGGNNPNHLLSEFLYDQNQRLQSYKDHYGMTTLYDYDLNGNVSHIGFVGQHVYYDYDQANRLLKVRWNSPTASPLVEYVYSGTRLNYVQYANGVRTTYGYDNAGRLNSQSAKTNSGTGTAICEYTFTMDNLGNHTQENIKEPFATLPTPPSASTSYTYTTGNRIQTAGSTTFGFDNDGNTTTKTGRTLGYDLEDNLTSVTGNTTLSYEYDAFGNRRRAVRNGEETRYVLDINGGLPNVLAELDGNGTAKYFYIHGLGLAARIKSNGTVQYYHADFRGSVVAMTDANQAISHQYQYDEFGNLTNVQEPANDRNDFRYVGTLGIMHETNDLTYMRARYYDPTIGRFNSEDPIWATNLYPYAGNNPIGNVDPSGMIKSDIPAKIVRSGCKIGKYIIDLTSGKEMAEYFLKKNLSKIIVTYFAGQLGDKAEEYTFTQIIELTIKDEKMKEKYIALYDFSQNYCDYIESDDAKLKEFFKKVFGEVTKKDIQRIFNKITPTVPKTINKLSQINAPVYTGPMYKTVSTGYRAGSLMVLKKSWEE